MLRFSLSNGKSSSVFSTPEPSTTSIPADLYGSYPRNQPPDSSYSPPQDTLNDELIAEILSNDPSMSFPFDEAPPFPGSPRRNVEPVDQFNSGTEQEQLDHAIALSFSLAHQSLYDIPVDQRPLSHPAECIACIETLPPTSFPSQAITSSCNHDSPGRTDSRICRPCLGEHLRVQLEGSGPDALTCPICHAQFAHEEVRQWASFETFQRYDDLKARSAVQTDDFVWCSAGCGEGQVHDGGAESPIVLCLGCGARTCFVHQNSRWHEGLTCHEFDNPQAAAARRLREATEEEQYRREVEEAEGIQRQAEDEARREREREAELVAIRAREEETARRRQEEQQGEAEVLSSSKPCSGPQCTYRITKTVGCKHITCTRCRFEWCWICLRPWVSGHLSEPCS